MLGRKRSPAFCRNMPHSRTFQVHVTAFVSTYTVDDVFPTTGRSTGETFGRLVTSYLTNRKREGITKVTLLMD